MRDYTIKENILFQLDMGWQLYLYHTDNLEEEETLWSFSPTSLQVRKKDNEWIIDWPESEGYEIGPPSIAWTMWHIIYWWSTSLDCNFGDGTLRKEEILWPGSIEKAKNTIKLLHDQWVTKLIDLTEIDYNSKKYSKWPLEDRSFVDIAL